MSGRWQFLIDRGGTFTDCLGIDPHGRLRVAKVLSSDRAPLHGIRKLLGIAEGDPIPACDVSMGTTLATNALLERKGTRTALAISEGFGDALSISDQCRPDLFALDIDKPPPLYSDVLELPARCDPQGAVLARPEADAARASLRELRRSGAPSLAVVVLHAYRNGALEREIAALAAEAGFAHVSLSHEVAAEIGLVARGHTTVVDAYLTPLIRAYVQTLLGELPGSRLRIMQSSGALRDAGSFRGRDAILSGPAAGAVAVARLAEQLGLPQVIGFDMGGTSTDVCRFAGELERVYETSIAGVRLRAPMTSIHTVAAGGGSICRFAHGRFVVGPESAGAVPGPLCYGRPDAEALTLTDVNLVLGRLLPDRFPFALERERAEARLRAIAGELAAGGDRRGEHAVAQGFFDVAVAHMAEAISRATVARGHDVRDHALIAFGGAAGQHACSLARRLGMRTLVFHPLAGVLSAFGMGLSDVAWHGEQDAGRTPLPGALGPDAERRFEELEQRGRASLAADGWPAASLQCIRRVDLRYQGSEPALTLRISRDLDPAAAFQAIHLQRFGYARPGHVIEAVTLRVEVIAPAQHTALAASPALAPVPEPVPAPLRTAPLWLAAGFTDVPVYARESLAPLNALRGPAIILDETGTLVLEPGFQLTLDARGVITVRDLGDPQRHESFATTLDPDPVQLELWSNRFMSIAEQMGVVLQRTALSTNIRERLDFSCAVFDRDGGLVANAPHIPVHLGAISESIRALLELHPRMRQGEVFATNDPALGGSHLPDVTVVTPVFDPGGELVFFTANRGHHADIGGVTPGSMPPFSTKLDEEGALLSGLRIVSEGRLDEPLLRRALAAGAHPARNPEQNIADLQAQIAANRKGEQLLHDLLARHGFAVADAYMRHVQDNAEACVRAAIAALPDGEHAFVDGMDDGTRIAVRIAVAGEHMRVDFTGSSPQVAGNLNAPRAVTVAAVLYVLRVLVGRPIPLNSGCMRPITLIIPEGSVLWPAPSAAVVAGNVETSQRVVDVLLGALGKLAACQGTMNNLALGNETFGYYETIAGGAGASAERDGASGVHTHMTNTRITDPEVLEAAFPLRLLRFAYRRGSGGEGHRRGGDGVVREVLALAPLHATILSERRASAPFGLAGGAPGARGANFHNGAAIGGRAQLRLAPGDVLRVETPGGGGHGSPRRGRGGF
jgi:5-oxoprolinase (ATP-hydrolysing)